MLSTPVKFNAPISKVSPEPLKHKTTIQSFRTENKELKNNFIRYFELDAFKFQKI